MQVVSPKGAKDRSRSSKDGGGKDAGKDKKGGGGGKTPTEAERKKAEESRPIKQEDIRMLHESRYRRLEQLYQDRMPSETLRKVQAAAISLEQA